MQGSKIKQLFEDDNSKYVLPTKAKNVFFRSLVFSNDENYINECMENFNKCFREALMTDTGESLDSQKDKIFYNIFQMNAIFALLGLPEEEINKGLLALFYRLENATNIKTLQDIHEEIVRKQTSLRNSFKKENPVISDLVIKCQNYIKNHVREPLSTKIVAEAVHHNQDYITHRFRTEVGCTVTEYITKQKMDIALRELAAGKQINLLSDELSFSSQSYFTSRFHAYIGLTPREYQRWALGNS